MARVYEFIALFIFTLVLQTFLFDNLQISNYINIYMYVVALMLLPSSTSGAMMLLYGAAYGMAMDLVSSTSGIYTIASILIGFIRGVVLKLFISHDDLNDNIIVTSSRVGALPFLLYCTVIVIINNLTIFYLDTLAAYSLKLLVPKFVISTVLTILLIYIYQLPLFSPHKSKK